MAPSPRIAPLLWAAVVALSGVACSAGGEARGGATESVPPRSVASVENASVTDQAVTATPTQPPASGTANRTSTTTAASTTTTAVTTTTTTTTTP
ncbi:MAG: hypothetical protein ACRDZZ_10695, partial [Ilumatobacteraceae bacterium]